ncbi:MAG: DUF1015 family protein [Myxococcales bacterium]|nr:DUF1015 family protein [Myxococcales bacterium]MDD9965130.1 DUF1015 family protein [Myxococcales bacterium]
MVRIRPFAALRPREELAARVASVPYDVVDRAEARRLAADNPLSFLHVVRPDIDLPDEAKPDSEAAYAQARVALEQMVSDGALVREDTPRLYLYRQEVQLLGKRVSQVGVVACCHIDDYLNDTIKKHEKTRKDKEDDRTRHVLSLRANTGPVFLAYRPERAVDALIARDSSQAPLYDFEAEDGVRHTVWAARDAEAYRAAFEGVATAYVADGHHRSASAARAGAELRKQNRSHTGDEEYNWYLCVLFASTQLNVLPYHRVVRDLGSMTATQFLERLCEVACVEPHGEPSSEPNGEPSGQAGGAGADSPGSFAMYLEGRWYRVALPKDSVDAQHPINSLDYVLLYDRILAPLLGIGDIRTDRRIDFVGGIHGAAGLAARVDSGAWKVAFAMRSLSVEQLMRVADAGEIMPPKSTWFEPKLRSGLLIHTF